MFTALISMIFTFTFMHLADAFIQSYLQYIQVIHFLSVCVFIICIYHVIFIYWYATPVRWMDYLGKGEVLTNTDLDRFVNNIWEK